MQSQSASLQETLTPEIASDLTDSREEVHETSDVPGQIPQLPTPEAVHTRERILSITAAEESFKSLWQRRVWCLIHFLKKIRPFGRRTEEMYVVK